MIPGLITSQSLLDLNTMITTVKNINYTYEAESKYSLGAYTRITSNLSVSSAIVFGLTLF